MADEPEGPARAEAIAAAIAGVAFATSAWFLRSATLLPPAFFDALAVSVLGFGLARIIHRKIGAWAGTAARGAGLVTAILLLTSSLVPPFDRMVPAAALWTVGATVLQANTRTQARRLSIDAIGMLAVIGALAWAYAYSGAYPEAARLRIALIAGGVAVVIGIALRTYIDRTRWRAFNPNPAGLLSVIAFTTVYLAYRALVAQQVGNLPLYEWSLAVSAAALLLARIRREARVQVARDAWTASARRHAQDVAPVYDRRMADASARIRRYLDTGAGLDDYRAAISDAAPQDPRIAEALDAAARAGSDGGRRKRAAEARIAAHAAVLAALEQNPTPRGQSHGNAEPHVRPNP